MWPRGCAQKPEIQNPCCVSNPWSAEADVKRLFLTLFLFLAVRLLGQVALAQGADVRGIVTDATGAVLPNATVILLDNAAVRMATTVTQNEGVFVFRDLPQGHYTLVVERSGFQRQEVSVSLPMSPGVPLQIQLKAAGPGTTVTVTAETGSFRASDASVATKMEIPIREIPQGIGVVNQSLIQSQQDVRFADAAENVSGVYRDVLAAGSLGNALTIRGLPLGVFSNYYEDGFEFDGMVPSDMTDVDRAEVLKGPSSVLYGRAASGGIVDLITKEPLPVESANLSLQVDRYGAVRPTVDFTGPIGSSQKWLYRVNGEFANTYNFRDDYHDRRYFLAPQLTWKPDQSTSVRVGLQYLHARNTTDYGILALGDRPAPVAISNFYGEPWQYSLLQNRVGTADASRSLGHRWVIRSRFRATLTNWDYLDTSSGSVQPDNQTLTRYSEDAAYPLRFYDWQTDLTGLFKTGRIEHNVLIGFEYGHQQVVQDAIFGDAPPINIYNPVPFSDTLPNQSTLTEYFFNPNSPDYFPIDGTTRLSSNGGYVQDHLALLPQLKALIGFRIEGFTQRYDEVIYDTHTTQGNVAFLPRIGLTYQPIQPVTVYASWSRSFAPTLAAQFTPGGQPFPSEYGQQYEGGVRTSEFQGRLSSTLSVYRIRASNLLITNPGNPLASIQIGTTGSNGIEFETAGRILPGWDLNFAYAFNEARILADAVYPVGNIFQNAPRHGGSLWTVYQLQRGPLNGLSFGGGFMARSYRFVDPSNDVVLPGYGRLDAMAGYVFGPTRKEEKLFKLSANIENVTDRKYFQSANTPSVIFPGSPINVLSRLEVRF